MDSMHGSCRANIYPLHSRSLAQAGLDRYVQVMHVPERSWRPPRPNLQLMSNSPGNLDFSTVVAGVYSVSGAR